MAVVGLVACGGGGPKLSEDDFLDEVNDICADVEAELDSLGEPADMAELATMGEDAKAVVGDAIAELDDLDVPDDLADDFDDWLDVKKDQYELYDEVIAAAEDEDQAALEEVSAELGELDAESNELAADLDLDDCITEDGEEPTTTDAPTTDVPANEVPTTEATVAPPVTEGTAPSAGGIDAYGLSEQFAPPLGYTYQDFAQDQLDEIAARLTTDPDLAVIDELAGADLLRDPTGEGDSSIIVFYADEGIAGTATETALEGLALSIAGGTPAPITTPAGRPASTWVDDDGDTQLLATTGSVTVWVLGYTSAYPDVDVAAVFDGFLDANAS
jgi:hypothetical protein